MEESQPRVSICIPAYEQPALLERCLLSIQEQTFTNYEVVVTDDSSTVDLQRVVDKMNDSRIRYYKNAVALGSPQNWNEAMLHARGAYVKMLHHDDWFASETALAQFVEVLDTEGNVDFVFSQCYHVSAGSRTVHKPTATFLYNLRRSPETCLLVNGIGAPSVTMFRKTDATPLFDSNTKWYVDVIFYATLLKGNNRFHCIQKPLINITTNAASQVTHTTPGVIKTREAIYTFGSFGYFTKPQLPALLVLHFAELFRRYHIDNFALLQEMGFEEYFLPKLRFSYLLSKIPVHFKLYALIRRIAFCFLPTRI